MNNKHNNNNLATLYVIENNLKLNLNLKTRATPLSIVTIFPLSFFDFIHNFKAIYFYIYI